MKSLHRLVLVGVGALAFGIVSVVDGAALAAETHQAKIALVDARAKALSLVPGTLVAEELEKENSRWIYSFEIKPVGEKGKAIKEVNMDADTGSIIGIETENN